MKRFVILTLVFLAFSGGVANAEHYGGMSRQLERRIERWVHAWFKESAGRMICIIRKESRYNPRAVNYAGPVAGLFQVQYPTWSPANPNIWLDARSTIHRIRQRARSVIRFWHGRAPSWEQFYRRLSDPIQSIRLAFILYRADPTRLGPWSYDGC